MDQLGFFVFMAEQEEQQKEYNNNYRSSDFNCSGETDEPHQSRIQHKFSFFPETQPGVLENISKANRCRKQSKKNIRTKDIKTKL